MSTSKMNSILIFINWHHIMWLFVVTSTALKLIHKNCYHKNLWHHFLVSTESWHSWPHICSVRFDSILYYILVTKVESSVEVYRISVTWIDESLCDAISSVMTDEWSLALIDSTFIKTLVFFYQFIYFFCSCLKASYWNQLQWNI